MSVAAGPADEARALRSEFISTLIDDRRDGRLGRSRSASGESHVLSRLHRMVWETVETVKGLAARVGRGQRAPVAGTSDGYELFLDDVTPHGNHPILFARPAAPMVRR